jgi:hypothetical protein
MSVDNTFTATSVVIQDTNRNGAEFTSPTTITPYTLTVPSTLEDNKFIRHTTGGILSFDEPVVEEGTALGPADAPFDACFNQNDTYGFINDLATYITVISGDLNLESSTTLNITIADGSPAFTLTTSDAQLNVPMQVSVYADATARDAAISLPIAGMVIYNSAVAKLQVYTTTWETITSV